MDKSLAIGIAATIMDDLSDRSGVMEGIDEGIRLEIRDTMAEIILTGVRLAYPDQRPEGCRNRLQDEGKPHPKSGCFMCAMDGRIARCPYEGGQRGS